jgi:divalent metal cation (Fe/Co/Zn/Cd) transporter
MPRIRIRTSMGIAFTILIAGVVVQSTDTLQLFGRDSFVPLIIGLAIIVIGVTFFLVRWKVRQGRVPAARRVSNAPDMDEEKEQP